MFACKNNWGDVKKYYQGTFVKFPDLTQDQIWKVENVDQEFIHIRDANLEPAVIELDLGYNIDFVIPKKTVFQYGSTASILYRIPARMWKKGLSDQNTKFECLMFGGWKGTNFSQSIIEGFVNKPSYIPFQTALKLFEEDSSFESAAITPRISVSRGGSIYIDQTMVGKYKKDGEEVVIKDLFSAEILPNISFKKVRKL